MWGSQGLHWGSKVSKGKVPGKQHSGSCSEGSNSALMGLPLATYRAPPLKRRYDSLVRIIAIGHRESVTTVMAGVTPVDGSLKNEGSMTR